MKEVKGLYNENHTSLKKLKKTTEGRRISRVYRGAE
jgi:hypothetical protein